MTDGTPRGPLTWACRQALYASGVTATLLGVRIVRLESNKKAPESSYLKAQHAYYWRQNGNNYPLFRL